ncbi:MAG: nicotinamide riboside transporter PnuC [Sphingobacteriales bacterium]|nr:MAG: nicotinamide riboside transporter PnuC [Sphingobacteriales bacterium]
MNWATIAEYISAEWAQITFFQMIAVAFSVAEVLLSYRNNVLLYPAGIISCALTIVLMLNAELYAESVLTVYYLVMSMYGWYRWMQRTKHADHLPISRSNGRDWLIVGGICVSAFFIFLFALKTYTNSTVPYMDSFVAATAWAGMWLLARRKLENWILLNISNIVAIPLLFYKHLPLNALLTLFLFIVAIFGYFRWKKIIKQENAAQVPEDKRLSLIVE